MRLENMLDINHELIKLSKHIDWESPDKEWGALFVSTKGAPAIRTRLIAGLHYLKHLHDLSDEQVVKGWTENPYWQYFCGEEYFQHKMPIHPVTMTKWRNRLGKSGSEKLLIETIKAGLKSKTIKPGSLKKVTVDTTVQEKNIAFPTDSKLLNKASIAVTNKEGFVIGAQSCPGNPYDGHTLLPQLEQIKQFTAVQPEQCFVDRGYRGHEVKDTKVFISGQKRGVTRSIKKALKRRSAIEPEIGHMKNDGRLDRCYLKGAVGDAINVVMVAAGHNLRKLLNKLRLLWLKIISGLMGYFIKPEQSAALNLA